ncbi:MAG: pyruvate, phosphate dikinase [Eubacteriaceae bacterium]|jgi:pyruvate,orthophosphate dikinase|nr:pyruvate, phosphate dikinase [Eubacteriaceae bacterium]
MAKKYVYSFQEANGLSHDLLGGKGAGLAEMTGIGLPVPQGITVTTEACTLYYENGESVSEEIKEQIFSKLRDLEKTTGKEFGGAHNPLLVSVRSGAKISMPGMMDTILNLGLNPTSVEALSQKTGNPRFAYDSYRRFIMMFSDVAIGIDKNKFEDELERAKEKKGVKDDTELDESDLKGLVETYKKIFLDQQGNAFPDDPNDQLMVAVEAIFKSWNNARAITYRKLNGIPDDLGTAVNIQSMVYGNMGSTSGTGVAFTRNPGNGDKAVFGEYLINAQGEDVVAGIRTPQSIDRLKVDLPEIYSQFMECANILENNYKDMQDIEFTIEEGKLYFLQTRSGKRTAHAALKVAVDLVAEGKIDKETALLRIDASSINQLLYPQFDPDALSKTSPVAAGLPASPGAATGNVYFTADDAVTHAKLGENVILVRKETSPEDIEGMHMAKGFLTAKGGMTSHAAVVARGMGKTCIAGCGEIDVHEDSKYFLVKGQKVEEGSEISINGTTGLVYLGKLETVEAGLTGDFETMMKWADEKRRMKIRANADTPSDAQAALRFGAEGIGLCRTEHMFFDSYRILQMRKMICSETKEQREEALNKILPLQKQDFVEIYKAMAGKPVTIRLLDPPLHEFLPQGEKDVEEIAGQLGISIQKLNAIISNLHEFNPMLGHRGCRLAVTYPEIAVMQTTAIIQAAIETNKAGLEVGVEIMVPLAGSSKEYNYVADLIRQTADRLLKESAVNIDYMVGTMIEIPRAALTSDEIAKTAEFFSFGTNDLTQMTMGFSRDDAGKFINEYIDKKILPEDPFQSIDQTGVGQLVRKSVIDGRSTRANLKCGVCGEHGGDPASIEFFESCGLDYVSCSPFRVPIARLSAAQAALKNR